MGAGRNANRLKNDTDNVIAEALSFLSTSRKLIRLFGTLEADPTKAPIKAETAYVKLGKSVCEIIGSFLDLT